MHISFWVIGIVIAIIIILLLNINGLREEIRNERYTRDREKKQYDSEKQGIESQLSNLHKENSDLKNDIQKMSYQETAREEIFNRIQSNIDLYPYLAGVMADIKTVELLKMEKQLDWGYDQKRLKKVQSIRTIRFEAKEAIEKAKEAEYQLAYILKLYPELENIIETDYKDLDIEVKTTMPDHDPARDYMTKEEWQSLDEVSRNQLALDRYVTSHRKTNWQIGRDYEAYVGYTYEKQEKASVIYTGSRLRLEDLGRDLIVRSAEKTRIIQCKYWSQGKQIHEKHILQLYGTVILYKIEHGISVKDDSVRGVLITNTVLSDKAKEIAEQLGIMYKEKYPMGDYPRIKCNIGRNRDGIPTKIYHLPMDLQYDNVVIDKKGEFYAFTVKEAVDKGFRRAFKWSGTD